jgi:hypothetical protein
MGKLEKRLPALVPDKVLPSDEEFTDELYRALEAARTDPEVLAAKRAARGAPKYMELSDSGPVKSVLKKLAGVAPFVGAAMSPSDSVAEALAMEALPPGLEPDVAGPDKDSASYDLEMGKIPESLKMASRYGDPSQDLIAEKIGAMLQKEKQNQDFLKGTVDLGAEEGVQRSPNELSREEQSLSNYDKKIMKGFADGGMANTAQSLAPMNKEVYAANAKKQAIKDLSKYHKNRQMAQGLIKK